MPWTVWARLGSVSVHTFIRRTTGHRCEGLTVEGLFLRAVGGHCGQNQRLVASGASGGSHNEPHSTRPLAKQFGCEL